MKTAPSFGKDGVLRESMLLAGLKEVLSFSEITKKQLFKIYFYIKVVKVILQRQSLKKLTSSTYLTLINKLITKRGQ